MRPANREIFDAIKVPTKFKLQIIIIQKVALNT